MNKKYIPLALIATGLSASALGQQQIEVITTTANRIESNLTSGLASQVIITEEQIALLNPSSVIDLLRSQAAIDISSTGGRGQTASLFLRGGNAGHTLILLDGVRIGSPTLGLADLLKVSVSNIERIEIVKGPRASLWGSDAISGVIQIFTKSSPATKVKLEVGSMSYRSFDVNGTIEHEKGSTSISVNHQESRGFDVLEGVEPDEDGYRYQSVKLHGLQNVNENLTLKWQLAADKGDNQYDSAWGGANASSHLNQLVKVDMSYQWPSNQSELSFANYNDDSETYLDGNELIEPQRIETSRMQISATNRTQVSDNTTFLIGTDLQTERVDEAVGLVQSERDLSGLFSGLNYYSEQWRVESSVRFDLVEELGSELTYNLALGYNFEHAGQLSLLQGTAFKVPTFNDLYWPDDGYSKGNDTLQPEESAHWELNYQQAFKSYSVSISAYHNEISNLIQWTPDSNFVYQPNNVNTARVKGLEISSQFHWLGGEHSISGHWINAKNAETNNALPLRAKTKFNYLLSYDWQNGLTTSLDAVHTGERKQYNWDGSITELKAFSTLNLNVLYEMNQNITVSVNAKDLFDKSQPTALGYNVAGREIKFAVQYQF